MTDNDITHNSVETTLAILAVSGIRPSDYCIDLLHKIQQGELTKEQAISLIREKYAMKIKITKCSDSMMWYCKHVGETYNVVRDYSKESNEFLVRDACGYLNIVLAKDCEIVKEKE